MSNSFSVFAVALSVLNEPSKSVWHPRAIQIPSSFTSSKSIPNKASEPRSRNSFTKFFPTTKTRFVFTEEFKPIRYIYKCFKNIFKNQQVKRFQRFLTYYINFKAKRGVFWRQKCGNSIVWWLNWLQLDSELASFIHPILSNSFFFGGNSKVFNSWLGVSYFFFQFSGNHWRQISIKSSKARNSSN